MLHFFLKNQKKIDDVDASLCQTQIALSERADKADKDIGETEKGLSGKIFALDAKTEKTQRGHGLSLTSLAQDLSSAIEDADRSAAKLARKDYELAKSAAKKADDLGHRLVSTDAELRESLLSLEETQSAGYKNTQKKLFALIDDLSRELSGVAYGDMDLVLDSGDPIEITAASLNAAAATTATTSFDCTFNVASSSASLYKLTPDLVIVNNVVDGDVADPAAVITHVGGGLYRVSLTMDTDAGATKTYVAAESLTFEFRVSATDTLLGHTVTSQTKTLNIT